LPHVLPKDIYQAKLIALKSRHKFNTGSVPIFHLYFLYFKTAFFGLAWVISNTPEEIDQTLQALREIAK
jgi:hypothetical protein